MYFFFLLETNAVTIICYIACVMKIVRVHIDIKATNMQPPMNLLYNKFRLIYSVANGIKMYVRQHTFFLHFYFIQNTSIELHYKDI